ncbi:MAG: AtpZ/AtpI family protein [Thermoleophilia bacterium]|jgi:ATP synthase protein I
MTDSPTEDRSGKEQGFGGVRRPQGVKGYHREDSPQVRKPYRGEERRQNDRRIGERRVTERRRDVDSPELDPGRKGTAGADARERDHSRFWYDFMRFNLTGWSVVIPTLAGLAIGNWIDNRYPADFSWALALMAIGLFLGCLNAWYWIRHHDHEGDK